MRNFAAMGKQFAGDGFPWLDALRKSGIARFEAVGFPAKNDEEWRHTQLDPIIKTKFVLAEHDQSAAADAHAEFGFGTDAVCEIVFVNGRFNAQLSKQKATAARRAPAASGLLTDAARIEPHLGRVADIEANPFVALNTGFLQDGAYLFLPKNTTVEGTIHLLFISTESSEPTVSHPRVLIIAEDNVEATIVESYVGRQGVYFTNTVAEIVCGADCRIDHCKLQQESMSAYHVAAMQVILGRATTFVSHAVVRSHHAKQSQLPDERRRRVRNAERPRSRRRRSAYR